MGWACAEAPASVFDRAQRVKQIVVLEGMSIIGDAHPKPHKGAERNRGGKVET
jgi:hypothetical protein